MGIIIKSKASTQSGSPSRQSAQPSSNQDLILSFNHCAWPPPCSSYAGRSPFSSPPSSPGYTSSLSPSSSSPSSTRQGGCRRLKCGSTRGQTQVSLPHHPQKGRTLSI